MHSTVTKQVSVWYQYHIVLQNSKTSIFRPELTQKKIDPRMLP